jgi:hypothetical protein
VQVLEARPLLLEAFGVSTERHILGYLPRLPLWSWRKRETVFDDRRIHYPAEMTERASYCCVSGGWQRCPVSKTVIIEERCGSFGVQTGAHSAGGVSVMPSHQTPPSGARAKLVKIVFLARVAMALGFVFAEVPGATPKKPASGLIARNQPSASGSRQCRLPPSRSSNLAFGSAAAE